MVPWSASHRPVELIGQTEEGVQPRVPRPHAVDDPSAGLHDLRWDRDHRTLECYELRPQQLLLLAARGPLFGSRSRAIASS